jgi:hypothetical protein
MPKSASQFIIDASTGKAIFMKAFDAFCSDDPETALQSIVDHAGYDLSPESLETAFTQVLSDKTHAISPFGGKYIFTEPSDLKDKAMIVNPTVGIIVMLGEKATPQLVGTAQFKWTLKKRQETYTMSFDPGYKIDELPKDHSCEGTRGSTKQQVKAYQKVPPAPTSPTSSPESTPPSSPPSSPPGSPKLDPVPDPEDTGGSNTPALIGSLVGVGGGLALASGLYINRKRLPNFGEVVSNFRQRREICRDIMLHEMRSPRVNVDCRPLQPSVDSELSRTLEDFLNDTHTDAENLTPDQDEAIFEDGMKRGADVYDKGIDDRYQGAAKIKYEGATEVADLPYETTVVSAVEAKAQEESEKLKAKFDLYVKAKLGVCKQKSISLKAAKDGTALRKAASTAQQDVETAETQIGEKQKAQEEVEKELRDKTISDERRQELEEQDATLTSELGQLQTEKEEAEQRRDAATEEAGEEDTKKQKADRKAKEHQDEADEHADDVFGSR